MPASPFLITDRPRWIPLGSALAWWGFSPDQLPALVQRGDLVLGRGPSGALFVDVDAFESRVTALDGTGSTLALRQWSCPLIEPAADSQRRIFVPL